MLNENFNPQKSKTVSTSITKISELFVIVPEEHNISLNCKDEPLNIDVAALLKRSKAILSLPLPLIPENYCSKQLLQILTKDNKILWDLITTLKNGPPLGIQRSYVKKIMRATCILGTSCYLRTTNLWYQQRSEGLSAQCCTDPTQASSA